MFVDLTNLKKKSRKPKTKCLVDFSKKKEKRKRYTKTKVFAKNYHCLFSVSITAIYRIPPRKCEKVKLNACRTN